MTFASTFSGVGGACLGLERAGLRYLWGCEVDERCNSVRKRHWPHVPNYPDVRTLDPDAVEVPDVLWMSPPCQDLSVAGKRAGLAGERSGLFYDSVRVLDRLVQRGTRFALMEQVPGLFSANGGEDFRALLLAFLDVGAVDLGWRVLDSQWFGVAQRRRRVFLVADFGGRCAEQVLALSQGLRGDSAPSRTAGQRVAGTLTAGSHPGSNAPGRRREDDVNLVPAVAGTLRSGGSGGRGWLDPADNWETLVPHTAHALTAEGFDASEDGTGRGTPIVPVSFGWNKSPSQTMRVSDRTTDALQASPTSNPAVAFTENMRSEVRESSVCGALAVGGGKPGQGYPAVREGMAVRRLTPKETERLQGFPDDWTRWGADGKEQADSTRYKQMGNAVTVNVAEWLGKNLVKAMNDARERESTTPAPVRPTPDTDGLHGETRDAKPEVGETRDERSQGGAL